MTRPRLFPRSPFFRFAAVLPVCIAIIIALLFVPIYQEARDDIRQQVASAIRLEIVNLEEDFHEGGMAALVDVIERRVAAPVDRDAVYYLADANGGKITGNIDAWPDDVRPIDDSEFRARESDGHTLTGHVFVLYDGVRLLVARRSPLATFRAHILRQLAVAGALATLLSALIAWLFAGRVRRRLTLLAQGADLVQQGELSHRLPVSVRGDEIDQLAARFNAAFERIEQLMEASREVSSAIAHDMRRPLTRLRNEIESLRDAGSGMPNERVESLLAQTDDVLRTFAALLRLARLESGSLAAERRPVEVADVVGDVVDLFEPVAEAQGRALNLSGRAAVVLGDRELLFQALTNLIDNALRYGAGDIDVELSSTVDANVISVRDHGEGVPEATLSRLFERFYRVDTSRADDQGSGVGLTLVRAIAQFHGGSASVANASPGLRVTLTLPIATQLLQSRQIE
ncbi:ATP-binding protein [Uliginosibacterium sp. sgz301328]|uniref:HAMP domain-containing sensor histidine kinase n=1 Tax=Uliginosibacterium sp. sgz301328 TaxID=3243764 RepID=UPI00359D1AD6